MLPPSTLILEPNVVTVNSKKLMTSATSKTYHHGDLRNNLIEAAITLINEKGISDLSLRQLARQVGVSHNAPYRHFETKEALLMAVAEEGFTSLSLALKKAKEASAPDSREQLKRLGVAYVNFALAHPAHYRVMFGNYRHDDNCDQSSGLASVAEQSFMVLVSVIREGQETGVFREGETLNLARIAWSLVHGQAMLALDQRIKVQSPEEFQALLEYSLDILSVGFRNFL